MPSPSIHAFPPSIARFQLSTVNSRLPCLNSFRITYICKNASANPLDSHTFKTEDLKSFRITYFQKQAGGGSHPATGRPAALSALSPLSSALTRCAPVTPLDSALTKTYWGEGGANCPPAPLVVATTCLWLSSLESAPFALCMVLRRALTETYRGEPMRLGLSSRASPRFWRATRDLSVLLTVDTRLEITGHWPRALFVSPDVSGRITSRESPVTSRRLSPTGVS